jgi:outer membrane lipoprotein-sorting protein
MGTKLRCLLLLIAVAVLPPNCPAWGGIHGNNEIGSQHIVDRILTNYAKIRDFEASVDVDVDNLHVKDMTEACLMWKQDSPGVLKMLYAFGSPYKALFKSDGRMWSIDGARGEHLVLTKEGFVSLARELNGADMFHMADILRNEEWSVETRMAAVNNVKCHRLYTQKNKNNYTVWADASTMTKVLRVKATDSKDQLQWQLDYCDFCLIDDKAWFPHVIKTRRYENGSVKLCSTYCFSNVVVNRGLPDSVFKIDYATPPTVNGKSSI